MYTVFISVYIYILYINVYSVCMVAKWWRPIIAHVSRSKLHSSCAALFVPLQLAIPVSFCQSQGQAMLRYGSGSEFARPKTDNSEFEYIVFIPYWTDLYSSMVIMQLVNQQSEICNIPKPCSIRLAWLRGSIANDTISSKSIQKFLLFGWRNKRNIY